MRVTVDESTIRGRKLPDPLYVVTASGCWEWQGTRMRSPCGDHYLEYGECNPIKFGLPRDFGSSRKGKKTTRALAHRVSYAQNIGPIPDGLVVRHKCDNPPCVNPDHLELGTRADNQRDMQERGRRLRDTCPAGHDRSPGNLKIIRLNGVERRTCKVCHNERSAEYYARNRDKINARNRERYWRDKQAAESGV